MQFKLRGFSFFKKVSTERLNFTGVNTSVMAADLVLTAESPTLQFLDPNAATRDVDLPAEALSVGKCFFLMSTAGGAEDLVMKDDGGGTIITISQNEAGIVFCNGIVWKGFMGALT